MARQSVFFLISLVAPDIKLMGSSQFNTNDVIMQLRHPACFITLRGRVYFFTFLDLSAYVCS